jgi:hypothetical protein
MSVVSPPSSNENVGNAGAGGSTSQLSAIAWSTSSISMNSLQVNNLYPAISSGSSLSFSWFQGKSFRVLSISSNNSGAGYVAFSYPGGANSGRSFRYDTYSYVQATGYAYYGYYLSYWQMGGGTIITGTSTITLYSGDYTAASNYTAVAYFSSY